MKICRIVAKAAALATLGFFVAAPLLASATDAAVQSAAQAAPLGGMGYAPLPPARILDSRSGPDYTTVDGLYAGVGRIGPGGTGDLLVTGRGGVPSTGVGAVVLNITIVDQTANTFITVFPTGTARPLASNLNPTPGIVQPNLVIAKVGEGGLVSIYNNTGSVNVIADVQGWFPAPLGASYNPLVPARIMETRTGYSTIDAQFNGIGAVGAGQSVDLTVVGRGGVPVSDVDAVAVNITAVNQTLPTYVTAYPTGATRPVTSNLNPNPSITAPNLALVKVGAGGKITIYNNSGSVDIIVDIQGWFAAGPAYQAVTPARLLETRTGLDFTTIDGASQGVGALGPASTLHLKVTGRAGVPPSGVGAVALNVTATNQTANSYLTVFPGATTRPLTSNLNPYPGLTAPNMVIARVGANGEVDIYNNSGTVDVLADVYGWFPSDTVAGADTATVLEDAAPTPIDVLANDVDNGGGPLTIASATQPTNGTVVLTGGVSGARTGLTYQPKANACNTPPGTSPDTFTYTLNGGVSANVAVTVTCVNDAPTFVAGPAQTVAEDAGVQTVAAWATAISPGPADESGQTVAFNVTNSNNALFSTQPAVSPTGTLTYTPAPDAFGSAVVNVVLTDNGGTANGGVDTSAVQTFTITVTPVNDSPVLTTSIGSLAYLENAPASAIDPALTLTDVDGDNIASATVSITGNFTASQDVLAFTNQNGITGSYDSSTGVLSLSGNATLANYQAALRSVGYANTSNSPNTATRLVVFQVTDTGTPSAASNTPSKSVTITSVNDPPTFTKGADQTVLEDAGAQSVPGWATAISPGPADESAQTVAFNITNNTNTALFAAGPAISSTGNLTYTPANNANGTATITIDLMDNGGTANGGNDTSATQTLVINVTAVNDPPSFTKGADQTVLEDAGAQSVPGWATAISPGPADESAQTVTFNITNNTNTALFSAGPAISPTGNLTYTPANNANGTATITIDLTDSGGTANGGNDTSATQTFTINVTAVNDPPSFTKGADQTVLEDAGAQSVPGWATAISPGPADESAQTVTFNITNNTNTALFAAGPAISPTGNLTYTPANNANGTATITINLMDNGGTANGGNDTSATQTLTINVTAVNDPPSFTKGADQTVLEDAGAQSVPGWATAISPGPADESAQTVTFNITNNTNTALFSAGPAISPTGTLTYTPAANAKGTATITINAQDNGGTANGGNDTSATQTFVINVTAVNDPPSFTKGADQTVLEDAGAQSVPGWATAISPGPADESAQTVTFNIKDNTNTVLFAAGPAISPTGTLTYTPANNANGTATITIDLMDNGGTANGGNDTSATQTFVINVTAVNDPPTSPGRAYGSGSLQANMQRSFDAAAGLLVGAADAADTGANPSYTPTFTLGTVNGVSPSAGTITTTIAGVGTVVANAADGSFTIDPAPGITGSVSFGFTVCDNGDGAPASQCSATATASFDIAGPVIWFVDTSAASNGAGTLSSPFNVLSAADTVDGANQRIFVYSGGPATATGLTLNSGEWLIGQAATGSFDSLFAITPPANTIARPTLGTGTATIGGTVALASSSKLQGVALSAGSSPGLTGSGGITSIAVSEVTVATTTGTGVNLNGVSGSVSVTGLTTTSGTGASLTGANSGATFDFSGVAVSSGSSPAITSTGGGTLTVTGSTNTLTSTTGTALNVANTTIGASGLNFRSISANGAASGIVLNNTGALGGLNVAGNGGSCTSAGDCTGGAIQNTTGAGIALTNTSNVSLTRMFIGTTGGSGIDGTGVTDFAFTNGSIAGSGAIGAADTSNIAFNDASIGNENNLSGVVTITGNSLTDAAWHGVDIQNFSGTISNANISNNTVTSSTSAAASLGSGIRLQALGSAGGAAGVTGATLSNNTIRNFPSGAGIIAQGGNTSSQAAPSGSFGTVGTPITINGNSIAGETSVNPMGTNAILATESGVGTAFFNITANGTVADALTNTAGITIAFGGNGNATSTFTIDNNVIVSNNGFGAAGISGGAGVTWGTTDHALVNATITNNTISNTDGNGILAVARGATGQLNVKIQNNTVAAPLGGVRPGIRVDAGSGSSIDDAVCLNISGNTSGGSGGSPGIGIRKQGTVTGTNDFGINGMAATATPQVETYVNGLNPAGGGTLLISATSGFSNCSLP